MSKPATVWRAQWMGTRICVHRMANRGEDEMSAPKHVLLRLQHRPVDGGPLQPTKATIIWPLERWKDHRLWLINERGYTPESVDTTFVITIGGLKRLKIVQDTLRRLDNA